MKEAQAFLGTHYPVRDHENVTKALREHENRSEWVWLRLADGDLVLGFFPQAELYEDLEVAWSGDWTASVADKTEQHHYAALEDVT